MDGNLERLDYHTEGDMMGKMWEEEWMLTCEEKTQEYITIVGGEGMKVRRNWWEKEVWSEVEEDMEEGMGDGRDGERVGMNMVDDK